MTRTVSNQVINPNAEQNGEIQLQGMQLSVTDKGDGRRYVHINLSVPTADCAFSDSLAQRGAINDLETSLRHSIIKIITDYLHAGDNFIKKAITKNPDKKPAKATGNKPGPKGKPGRRPAPVRPEPQLPALDTAEEAEISASM